MPLTTPPPNADSTARSEPQILSVAPEERLRIRFPHEGFDVSGGFRVILQIASGLAARGHDVTIIGPDFQSETGFPCHPGLKILPLVTRRRGPLRKIEYLLKLTRIAARDCDVCVATTSKTPLYILLSLLQNRNRPAVMYLIQGYERQSHAELTPHPWPVRKVLAALISFGYRLPFHQVAVSHWVAKKIKRPACHVIPNGIDLDVFRPLAAPTQRAKFTVGVIGSAARGKGYAEFAQAVAALPEAEKREIALRVAGKSEVTVPDGVEFAQIRPNGDAAMREFYADCDLFVFPSYVEGFGLPPLEAMACGTPVLITDCGGIREYANETNAVIVPPANAAALTQAILRLKNDPALREKLRQAGLQTAQKFPLEGMIRRHIAWLETAAR